MTDLRTIIARHYETGLDAGTITAESVVAAALADPELDPVAHARESLLAVYRQHDRAARKPVQQETLFDDGSQPVALNDRERKRLRDCDDDDLKVVEQHVLDNIGIQVRAAVRRLTGFRLLKPRTAKGDLYGEALAAYMESPATASQVAAARRKAKKAVDEAIEGEEP